MLIAFLLWALWYVNNRGFTRKWRGMVTKELVKRGIHAEIGRLNLDPLKGLIARNVRIVHGEERGQVLAYLDEIVLDINYSNLVYGTPFIHAVDLREASVSLPVDPTDRKSPRLEITGINARILFPHGQIYIPQAEADVHGLRLTATDSRLSGFGDLPPLSKERSRERGAYLLKLRESVRHLAALQLHGGKPTMEVRFHGDVSQANALNVELTFRSEPFRIGNYRLGEVALDATWQEGLLRLHRCVLHDEKGAFDLSATLRPSTRTLDFQLRSTLDLPALFAALDLPWKIKDLTLHAPAMLEAAGTVATGGDAPFSAQMTGRFALGAFAWRGITFLGAQGDVAWKDGHGYLRHARLNHQQGSLLFSLLHNAEGYRFSLDSRIDPTIFNPLLPPKSRAVADDWSFEALPHLRFEGRAATADPKAIKGSGSITLGRSSYRKIPLQSLEADFTLKDLILDLPSFRLRRSEGGASGGFSFDFGRHFARLSNITTTVTPSEVALWVDRRGHLPKAVRPYRFPDSPPRLKLDGTVGLPKYEHLTDLKVDVDTDALEYTFVKKDLRFPFVKADLRIIGERLKIDNLRSSLYGGNVKGHADISIHPRKGDYTAFLEVDQVDFPSLTKLYFNYDTSKGKLKGRYRFSGVKDIARNITGEGEVAVINGNVFAIPLFGPFSGILEGLLPGTGYNVAREANTRFSMKEGVIEAKDLEVKGTGFSMYGKGKLFFLDDKIDFSIRINAQGAAGVLLTPVSHLFEYVSQGSLSKPEWRPKHLPSFNP